ncbi:valine--tRNA ligase [Campylobacter sp. 19-13652]|uniref:valine--tRNA ligase n=1 Tax=Campylobacter sp. 19-13652 TaxID=2840180 RepID=UPI001C75827B|nr:valine--tRNA ligase [Campylobacter sp. 19-13652]BCX79603.1 valine--tRNA ligase [Campylobacter sp. 19-13652]
MADFYNPKEVEEKYYKICEERGYFETDGNKNIQNGKSFCIMMPPPNVTGVLHIGHALTFTLQDIITRYKRMDGFTTLWQPGLDHAGIATQNVVEKQLLSQGLSKEELGRSEFLNRVWQWKEKSGGTINAQMRRLGVTPAWSRERFTMDEGLKNAVKKAFVNLYEKGLIYRGDYMINWCTHDGALSDVEVEHKENRGKLYHLRYPLASGSGEVIVATTRPETYFGDTAVMVNPNDERYAHLVGASVRLPIINREIKIIADSHVDMDFGTGVVKVTPAHDVNDYEVGKRHDLEFLTIFDEKGILNEHCGQFAGLERLAARDVVVAELERLGFVEKIEEHINQVGHCYRCKNVVEPYISKQWFVSPKIADEAIKMTNEGQAKFYPAHYINSFNAWMRELRPWCISRQLWWGHQIPVFYCDECGYEWADEGEPAKCPKCGSDKFKQDPDVLDTWFSSGLWPISTLGWGNGEAYKNEKWFDGDLEQFYPNTMLITGFDILFFWVARMMFQCENATKKLPFSDIYLHSLVKTSDGKKMSKSSGNIIDPLDVIDEYSADVLRFTLTTLAAAGRDIRLGDEALTLARNFTNKIYNASKYLLLNAPKFEDFDADKISSGVGKYMLARFYNCVRITREHLENYRFNDAADAVQKFLWDDFCDWGIELSKADKGAIAELGSIFKQSLKLLSPFMPFISEHLYHELSGTSLEAGADSIMIARYPVSGIADSENEAKFNALIEAVVSIRRAKASIDLGNAKIPLAYVLSELDLSEQAELIATLAKCEKVEFVSQKVANAVADVSQSLSTFVPLAGVDTSEIIKRLNAQKSKLEKEIAKLENMLGNEKFIANAPENVVAENKAALDNAKERLEKVVGELRRFK